MRHLGALVVGKEKEAVREQVTAQRSSILLAIIGCFLFAQVIGRIQIGVARKLEGTAVERIRAGFGGNQHLPAAEVSVLRVKVAG